MTVSKWFSKLQAAEAVWIHEAKHTELPDFESTVLEYQSQLSTPASETSEEDVEERFWSTTVPAGGVLPGRRKQAVLGLETVAKALEAL